MIDFHVHLGKLNVDALLSMMDENGIDRAILQPIDDPGQSGIYFSAGIASAISMIYPERFNWFCSYDFKYPRERRMSVIEKDVQDGCAGYGEHKVPVSITDDKCYFLYRKCGELGIPILIHMDDEFNTDRLGLPGLNKMVSLAHGTNFVLHGQGWWAEISGDCDRHKGYPEGKIKPGGAVDGLLSDYDNVYADLSAGSAYNALTRDPDYTPGFLERHWEKLIFATDYSYEGQKLRIIDYIKNLDMDADKLEAIQGGNVTKLLNEVMT
jgi:predicted TIM-barrel fold metal-dependent hydrolase